MRNCPYAKMHLNILKYRSNEKNKNKSAIKLHGHLRVHIVSYKYLQRVNKFLAVVEEELQLKTVRLLCGQNFKFKGAGIFRKIMEPKFPGNMHLSSLCPKYLPSF